MKQKLTMLLILSFSFCTTLPKPLNGKPDRTILFIIDGMTSGLHKKIDMSGFKALLKEGVLFEKVYLPIPAHPDSSADYPWTCSIPNPVLMSGTIFIGQEGIKQNLIQHSFTKRPTAFLVNAWTYSAISHGFTFYEDLSNGKYENVFNDKLAIDAAKKNIIQHNPEFIRIHCQGPGSAGYKSYNIKNEPYSGNIWVSESPFIQQHQYVDSLLGDFVGWLKNEDLWKNTVIFVMGDHGQADSGWHPPYEHGSDITQMVIAGAGIKSGVTYDYAEIIDVAPTIAWLHKVNTPKFSTGRILKEIKTGNKPKKTTDRLLKDLNQAQIEYHSLNPENRNDSFFTIEQIGNWHKGRYKNDYRGFVNQQVEQERNILNKKGK